MPDILACPGCAQSLKEGYHPIRLAGERKAFVCSPECADKWLRFVGEIQACSLCGSECPANHNYIDWGDGDVPHFCSDEHVIEWMARNDVRWAYPSSQEGVNEDDR